MNRLKQMIARGVVAMVDSARKLQTLQLRLTADEVKDGVEHFEPYGYTSCPLPGAEHLTVFPGGDRSHGITLVVADRRYRLPNLKGGEVALYTDEGDFIHLKRGRIIDIETETLNIKAAQGVHFDTPTITQTGSIESVGDQIAGGVSQINHPHKDTMPAEGYQSGPPVRA